MERSDSNDAAGARVPGADADKAENRSDSSTERPSAIERQMAAAPRGFDYRNPPHSEPADHTADRYVVDYNSGRHRRRRSRFGLKSLLLLLFLVAVGVALMFLKTDNPLLQQLVDTNPPSVAPAAHDSDAPPVTTPPSAIGLQSENTPQPGANDAQTPSEELQTPALNSQTATSDAQAPAGESSMAEHETPATVSNLPSTPSESPTSSGAAPVGATNTGPVSATNSISIPTADISLRDRPELLEQLVAIYRAQLAADPNNTSAQTALAQLQEHSLAELQTIVLAGDDAAAVKLLEIVARLFPEAADNARYKYLAARADRQHRQKNNETTTQKKAASSQTNAASNTAKTSENSASLKPEIRSVSITPGTMVSNRFVPSDGGNVFMVEVSYRNFDRAFVGEAQATLVTRLGAPGDSMVLAEAPVVITADRGTKNFLIETTSVRGYAGGKLQLNFILNDEFLTSRTVRLSMPR